MRFWREHPVATQAAGATATLGTAGTVGYEWDEDADNGFRPAGLIDLSDHECHRRAGAAGLRQHVRHGQRHHHLTLYRAPSGALVFGAGTIQWSWGLDSNHDRGSGAAERVDAAGDREPVRRHGRPAGHPAVRARRSYRVDRHDGTRRPRSPRRPAARPSRRAARSAISGTATDTGGGVVGGVEVSTDGGTTWHPATGRGTWTYTWTPGCRRHRDDQGPGDRRQRQHRHAGVRDA